MRLLLVKSPWIPALVASVIIAGGRGANAGLVEIPIDSAVNADLSTYTRGDLYPPGGSALIVGGVNFTLATGAVGGPGSFQTDSFASPSATIPGNVFGLGAVARS